MINKLEIDFTKLRHAIHGGFPIAISSYTLPRSIEVYISEILQAILKELDMEYMFDYLSYCLSELIVNAKKANTKRVYFQESGLDINESEDYKKGMVQFKTETLNKIDYYLQKQKEAGLYVKVIFQIKNKNLIIEIRNNSEMLMCEYTRIHDKLARSRQFNRDDKVQIAQLVDDSEGAGLGLILIMQMFHKIGLGEDNYEIIVANGETITRVTIPFSSENQESTGILSGAISTYISNLAPFPENILRLQELIKEPDVKISDIAYFISTDVALTADLLRFVNSAAFALGKQCANITEAIKFIGLRSLKNILYGYGSQKLLGTATEEQRNLWDHCYRVGYYAFNLVKQCNKDKNLLEDVYTCGILHDMGKIIFYNSYPDFEAQMQSICDQHHIPGRLLESIIGGSNHAEIGALIAEKWNFPDKLCAAIRFHHNPMAAPESIRKIVQYIYVANGLVNFSNGIIEFDQMNADILSDLGITEEPQFTDLAQQLENGYQQSISSQNQ